MTKQGSSMIYQGSSVILAGELKVLDKIKVEYAKIYLQEKFIKPMVRKGILEFKYPDMINHPRQAYSTVN